MKKPKSTAKHQRSFKDKKLLFIALDIIRRFNSDEIASAFGHTRQAQSNRTTRFLKKWREVNHE